jgi:hypothetical protein
MAKTKKEQYYPSGHRWVVNHEPGTAACLLSVLLSAFEDRNDISDVDKARARVAHQVMSDVFDAYNRRAIEARRDRLAEISKHAETTL